MRNIWMFILPPIAIAVIVILVWAKYKKTAKKRTLKKIAVIAHTETIKKLPAYRKAVRNYKILLVCALLSFVVSIFSLTAAAARPIKEQIHEKEADNRDIMFCLDVSGSMLSDLTTILEYYKEFSNALKGQRVGITIFDGVAATIIPLTDDYDAVNDLIDDFIENRPGYSSAAGGGRGSSMIGDGVVSCVNAMGIKSETERSRSIILVTDNYAASEQTVNISQAANYAARNNITIYGITNVAYSPYDSSANQYQGAVKLTGGSFYSIKGNNGQLVTEVVDSIFAQEASKFAGTPELVRIDAPELAIIASAISFLVCAFALWRLRL